MKWADAIIIGGGVIGAAIFHELVQAGMKSVVLVEKGRMAIGATGASGGFLRVYHPDPYLTDLASESFPHYLHFEEEFGTSCGYVKTGLFYLEPPGRVAAMEQEVARLQREGFAIQTYSPEEARHRFSSLNLEGIGGAVYEEAGGYADPVRTTWAFIERARELGGLAVEGVLVEEILVKQGKVAGVRTSMGTLESSLVILAAGAWSPRLLANLKAPMTVRSKTIQVHFFKRPAGAPEHPAFLDDVTDLYGRSDRGGVSLIGYPVDEWDIDPDVSRPVNMEEAEVVRQIAKQRFPWAPEAVYSGGRRSFDGYTPDARGLLGFSPEIPGLLYATGWSGGGFKLAPGIAKRVRKLVQL